VKKTAVIHVNAKKTPNTNVIMQLFHWTNKTSRWHEKYHELPVWTLSFICLQYTTTYHHIFAHPRH